MDGMIRAAGKTLANTGISVRSETEAAIANAHPVVAAAGASAHVAMEREVTKRNRQWELSR